MVLEILRLIYEALDAGFVFHDDHTREPIPPILEMIYSKATNDIDSLKIKKSIKQENKKKQFNPYFTKKNNKFKEFLYKSVLNIYIY